MHKELVFSLADLRYVSIECARCKTKLVLDMKEVSDFSRRHGVFAPKDCPGCHEAYDPAIRPSVDAFRDAYKNLTDIGDSIRFLGNPEVIPSPFVSGDFYSHKG